MWFMVFALSIASAASIGGNKVDLSRRGLRKEFFRFNNESLINKIDNATELNLQGNCLDSFLDCSARLTKLEVLDLSQNELSRFMFLCMDEYNLRILNVSHNQIYYINESHTLTHRVSKLKVLDISFNLLEHIGSQTFQHMENLHILKLNANPIRNNFEERSFQSLLSLVDLDLSNISAFRFPAGLFISLFNLTHISLAHNPLVSVPVLPAGIQQLDISGTNIIKLDGIDYPNLLALFMRSMPLMETLDLNQLARLSNLAVLSTENSPRFKALTFEPRREDVLLNLREISLKNCVVGKIGEDLLPIMRRTPVIDLQKNPWQCDCSLKWILDVRSTEDYRHDVRCESPNDLRGKRVFELSPVDFGCGRIFYLVLWFVLGFMGAAVVFGSVVYMARKPLRNLFVKPRYGNTVIYKNMTTAIANDGEKILDQCDITDYL